MKTSLKLDRRPLYAQAHDRLLALIEEKKLGPGDRLPSETQLADQLGISRATLREALRLLEEERIIIRRQGVGTFVAANHHLESGLERLESVLALASRQGMRARIQDLLVDTVEATRKLADRLQIPLGARVTKVCRTILVEGQPVAYMEDLVPAQWLTPADIDNSFDGSVLDLLRQELGPHVQEAMANITAVCASQPISQRLGVLPQAPLLLLEETLFDTTGRPVGFSRNYFAPDRLRFHVLRR